MPHARSVLSFLAACSLCLALFSCAPQNPAAGAAVQKEVQFLDSFSFDRKLSASLSVKEPEVDVLFPAAITLNNIPERMDKWLSKVEKFGGTVSIQAEPEAGRGIITEIFSLFVKMYEAAEEAIIYKPAKDYNVVIHYQARTGIVTRLAFVRKDVAAAKPAAAGEGAAGNQTEANATTPAP